MSDTERRSRDTKVEVDRRRGPDALRTNPEVMERSEPQSETAPQRNEMSPSPLSDARTQFDHLQSEFIDDPKSAVQKAHQLMDELLTKMRERLDNTHRDVETSNDDTEKLRLAMRSYRDMIDPSQGRRNT